MRTALALAVSMLLSMALEAQDIELPKPVTSGGMPLLDALAKRSSNRAFLPKELSSQELSDLLWAADGVNRENGKRTAPTAMNLQEIDIYVLLKSGVYVYDASAGKLVQKSKDDVRPFAGLQPFVKDAPLSLVYVVDYSRMTAKVPDEMNRRLWSNVDTGFISQNVYLYCATKGLATVVLAFVDKAVLGPKLGLKDGVQEITYSQPVGHPDPARLQR